MVYELDNTSAAEHLFAGNDDFMVRSCLQGMMDGKYRHPEDDRRIYEIFKKDDKLFYHFVNPDNGMTFDLRMYPIGEKTFGINYDDFELVFPDNCLALNGLVCKKM